MLVSVIMAFAGNRVDADDRDGRPRFPASQTDEMCRRVARLVTALEPRLVVGAAAAGADLLVLEAAMACGVRIDVVLPAPVNEFRERSVADRGSAWTAVFDRVVTEASERDEHSLVEHREPANAAGYEAGNRHLLDEALRQAEPDEAVVALAIRPPATASRPSITDDFVAAARSRNLLVVDLDPGVPAINASRVAVRAGPERDWLVVPVLEDADLEWQRSDTSDHAVDAVDLGALGGGIVELSAPARPAEDHDVVVAITRLSAAVARATPSLAPRLASAIDSRQE